LLCADRDAASAWLACLHHIWVWPLLKNRIPERISLFLFFQASKKLVAATGQQCLPLSIDVRQPQTIVAAVDETLKQFKQIDILVNGEQAVGRLARAVC